MKPMTFGEMKGHSAMRKAMRPKTYKKKILKSEVPTPNPFTLPKNLKFPIKFRKHTSA